MDIRIWATWSKYSVEDAHAVIHELNEIGGHFLAAYFEAWCLQSAMIQGGHHLFGKSTDYGNGN